jgi:hypothetical protein
MCEADSTTVFQATDSQRKTLWTFPVGFCSCITADHSIQTWNRMFDEGFGLWPLFFQHYSTISYGCLGDTGFEVLTVVVMKIPVFLDITLCSALNI